ncbi:MAG: Gfo/Idh/MocA family oxidoreductase [Clostridiaceae bacterium]|jgi:predicted dehydrogenase|nr:Gfo/Idh/MocA family oxidoreductase [Clostridiaceae bacterium]
MKAEDEKKIDKGESATKSVSQENRPIRCALIGCGRVAVKHLKAIKQFPGALSLAGVADPHPEAARRLFQQADFGQDPVASGLYDASADRLLDDRKPDLVAITTPSGTHTQLALKALDAGCHVLVEKPMTLSLKEADQLIVKAEANHRILAVGHIYRYFPLIQMLQKDLLDGRFGTILSGRVTVYWGHDQAYYDAADWRGTWQQDGGALMNQCVHALDLMLYLIHAPIIRISGWIDQIRHQIEAEDYGLVQMQFANGAYGILEGSTATDPRRQEASFSIQCSRGSINLSFCRGKPSIRIIDETGHNSRNRALWRFARQTLGQEGIQGLRQVMHPHTVLYRDLIKAIQTGEQPIADGYSGRQAVEAVLAAYASALKGRTLSLPIEPFEIREMNGFFERLHMTEK